MLKQKRIDCFGSALVGGISNQLQEIRYAYA